MNIVNALLLIGFICLGLYYLACQGAMGLLTSLSIVSLGLGCFLSEVFDL